MADMKEVGPKPVNFPDERERDNKKDVKGVRKTGVAANKIAKKTKENDARTSVQPFNKG